MIRLDKSGKVHFHHSDPRFCGSRARGRQFTFDVNAVTCPKCDGNITVRLSAQGQKWVDEHPLKVTA
jgi:hypothetical protein